jgi:hypothetical protein
MARGVQEVYTISEPTGSDKIFVRQNNSPAQFLKCLQDEKWFEQKKKAVELKGLLSFPVHFSRNLVGFEIWNNMCYATII